MQDKRIGIWGLGVSGQALVHYLAPTTSLAVMDSQQPSPAVAAFLQTHTIPFYHQDALQEFFQHCEYVIPSPGINLTPYYQYLSKCVSELDLFYSHCTRPIIGITGTVGKTSTTTLLAQLLTQAGLRIQTGGNIGTGMMDLLQHQDEFDYMVLELSSFQLEYCTLFKPKLMIWTNLYPNHLDRHTTLERYCVAKYQALARQEAQDIVIAPTAVYNQLKAFNMPITGHAIVAQEHYDPSCATEQYAWENNAVYYAQDNKKEKLLDKKDIPDITFDANWALIYAAVHQLTSQIPLAGSTLAIPDHRIEKVATIRDIEIYNDSKSTIIEATLAAVHKLADKPLHLIIGGISKGVDRSSLFSQLPSTVKSITLFGAEAAQLAQSVPPHIACYQAPSLAQATHCALEHAKGGERILFSPSGASYDLFTNYQERGNCFKNIIEEYQKSS